MLLALLAGCGCPTFADLAVVDPDGIATDDELTLARQAIADFAAWTLRDGVCVDEVRIIEAIDWEPYDAAGQYQPGDPVGRIYVETGGGAVRKRTLHELAHALDHDEAITATFPGLFPPAEGLDPELYPTAAARRLETFAQACEDGPTAQGLERAFESACNLPALPSADRYVADAVFIGHTDVPVLVDGFPAQPGAPVELLLPERTYVGSVAGDAAGLLLLTVTSVELARVAYATLHRISLPDGAIVGSWRLPLEGVSELSGQVYRRDGGPPVVRLVNGAGETATYTLDEASGTLRELPLDAPAYANSGGVVTNGTFWYLSSATETGLALRGVRVADGAAVAAPALAGRWFTLWDATPAGDALLVLDENELVLVDLASGGTTPVDRPGPLPEIDLVGWLDDQHLLLGARGHSIDWAHSMNGYARYDREAAAWALSEDPCETVAPWRTVLSAGAAWIVYVEGTDTGGQRLLLRPLTLPA
jgi:hypothetical protein